MLRVSGFEVREIFYRNSLLFPLAALRRLLSRGARRAGAPRSDVSPVPAPINAALLSESSRWTLSSGGPASGLPFGLSVFCVARRG